LIQSGPNLDEQQRAALREIKLKSAAMDFVTLVDKCQKGSLMPDIFINLTPTQIEQTIARNDAYCLADMQYYAHQIPIPVHLFIAQDNNTNGSLLGWNTVVPKSLLRVVPIPGTHHSIMRAPNVETLGKALSNAIHNSTEELREPPEKSYSPLFKFRARRNNIAPLFCIPGAGASVTSFVELVAYLNDAWSIYGFQPRGLDGTQVPHSTVSAAADAYLRAIDEVYQEGPVHLFGHSFGGWVALEMVHRLLEKGRTVASLTILDSEAPDDDAVDREYNNTDALMQWIDIFEQLLEHPLGIGRSDFDSRNEAEQRKLLHARLVREGLMPKASQSDVLRGPLRTFMMSLRTRYTPDKPYRGAVQLVLVDDPKKEGGCNRRNQEYLVEKWKLWAPNLVCTHARGNHLTVLNSPHVQALAKLIEDGSKWPPHS